jgi:exopolysaccharide biosynthesis protein
MNKGKFSILLLFFICLFINNHLAYSTILNSENNNAPLSDEYKLSAISFNTYEYGKVNPEISHKRVKRWLNGKPAIVNILMINPKGSYAKIKPSYGSYYIDNVKRVKDIARMEGAVAAVNASYFKPDSGAPLGTSIINNTIITGPLFRRVTFGITQNNEFKMDKINLSGLITIGDKINLNLFNVNQPVFSRRSFSVFTDKWGKKTPYTSHYYSHIVVSNNIVCYVKNSRVTIPKGGYVIVGPHSLLPKSLKVGDKVSYTTKIAPEGWDDVEFAVSGGPYLVRNGKKFIDKQMFSRSFLWNKSPRTAVGYTRAGTLILTTIDGRIKGYSEGATISELATIMHELGCYQAMNLDGGTSTQMVYRGNLVNTPSVSGGAKVTNGLMIVLPKF